MRLEIGLFSYPALAVVVVGLVTGIVMIVGSAGALARTDFPRAEMPQSRDATGVRLAMPVLQPRT